MPKPVILMRNCLAEEGELQVSKRYFDVISLRSQIQIDDFVIPRYSSLPYHSELEADVILQGGKLINNTIQHNWIANFQWYWRVPELRELTPKTWHEDEFYKAPEGEYVVKGKTNSRKENWQEHMYAGTKRQAVRIGSELYRDSLIGSQGIIYREYTPLKTFEIGINGIRFTNEHRFFILDGEIVDYGYYWSNAENTDIVISDEGKNFAKKVIDIIGKMPRFYVIDVAERLDGTWTLIEINDACMSGLSCISPESFYKNLSTALKAT